MTSTDEFVALTKAFSGLGADEQSLISTLGKWNREATKTFKQKNSQFFVKDEDRFERWDERKIGNLEREFSRFKNAVVLWIMHPWERDARFVKGALDEKTYGVVVEIVCTRSSDELLGARKAYHSLYDLSIEEDVADRVADDHTRKLLVALVSSYRYEGTRVKDATANTDATKLSDAIKNGKNLVQDEHLVRILATRSKNHLKEVFKKYKEKGGDKSIEEDLEARDQIIKETVQCLYAPEAYFSNVLDGALKDKADENNKDALTRVIVTQSQVDTQIKKITKKYHEQYKVTLADKIAEMTHGNYKEFLKTLVPENK